MLSWFLGLNWYGALGAFSGLVLGTVGCRVLLLWPHVVDCLKKIDRPTSRIQYLKLVVVYLVQINRIEKR